MKDLRLKVSGIASLTDARYCAGMGVEILSLQFNQDGVCSLRPDEFRAIRAWIEGVEWFGEFVGTSGEILTKISLEYELSTWILQNDDLLENAESILTNGRFIRAVDMTENLKRMDFQGNLEIELSGEDWKDKTNLFVATENDLRILKNPASAEEIIAIHSEFPKVIFSIQSGMEERPGWMDLSHLQDILEELEEKGFYYF